MIWGLAAIPVAGFVLAFRRDPRSMLCALLGFAVVMYLAFQVLGAILSGFSEFGGNAGAWALLAMLLLVLLLIVGLGVVLVLNGLTMVRREGRRPANLLSLLLGLGMLGMVAAAVVVVASRSVFLFLVVLFAAFPLGYLSFGFLAYLLYARVYQRIAKGSRKAVSAVVVLGSGLIDGRVPPLLASRLDEGRRVYDAAVAAGVRPLVVTSGGRGADEPRAEADAMAEYLTEHGVPADQVVTEAESRTTEENLANTAVLLAEHQVTGPVAVVTNNFHAFRSALLMRRAGLPGYVLGSPTASYYWPSATIREYVAILRDHAWLNGICLGLLTIPLVVVLVRGW